MSTSNTGQLRFAFPEPTARFEDLCITGANRTAFAVIRGWVNWPGAALCLVGPPECGLTTAMAAWSREATAYIITARQFDTLKLSDIEELAGANLGIDRAERLENWDNFLTLINLAERRDTRILLTARTRPSTWEVTSADLRSRLLAMPVAEVSPPDEEMIAARLHAAARQRYLKLDMRTVNYLATRLETSYAAIEDFARRLDSAVSEWDKAPTIPLVRQILEAGVERHPPPDQSGE